MKSGDCTELCFCSNRNEIGEDDFSRLKMQINEIIKEPRPIEKSLSELGVVYHQHYIYQNHRVRLGISLFVMPAENQMNRILKELESRGKGGEIGSVIDSMKGLKCSQPSFSVQLDIYTMERQARFRIEEIGLDSSFKRILLILGNAKQGKLPVQECVELVFDAKTTSLSGGLSLPTRLPLSKDLIERVGESMITGLTISFKDSPIQIGETEFYLRNDDLVARIKAYNRYELSEYVVENVYQHALEISKLFLSIRGEG